MELNGGRSASYLASTLCVPLFCTLFNSGRRTEQAKAKSDPWVAPWVRPREPPREHPRGLIPMSSALQGLPTKHPTKVSTEGPTSGWSGFTCPVFTCSVLWPNRGGNGRACRLPVDSEDHFHCTVAVEPSPGHTRCRMLTYPNGAVQIRVGLELAELLATIAACQHCGVLAVAASSYCHPIRHATPLFACTLLKLAQWMSAWSMSLLVVPVKVTRKVYANIHSRNGHE